MASSTLAGSGQWITPTAPGIVTEAVAIANKAGRCQIWKTRQLNAEHLELGKNAAEVDHTKSHSAQLGIWMNLLDLSHSGWN